MTARPLTPEQLAEQMNKDDLDDAEVQIVLPQRADDTDPLEHGLITLTEAIAQLDEDAVAHGFLGGEFGYGAQYENSVFVMRPFYWGDCDCGQSDRESWFMERNHHALSCYQVALSEAQKAAGLSYIDHAINKFIWIENEPKDGGHLQETIYTDLCGRFGVDRHWGAAVHCTCGYEEKWTAYITENGHRPTCAVVLPNFRHHASGLEVRWYKWIGRDMEIVAPKEYDIQTIFSECLGSLISAGKTTP